MKKQLTMIKVAGVAISLAAAGIAGMANAEGRTYEGHVITTSGAVTDQSRS